MQKYEIDSIDKKILSILQNKGRISNVILADKVGLSPSACLRRVKVLEEEGIIVNYSAILDEGKIGLGTQTLVMVTLKSQHHDVLEEFETEVKSIPNVLACYLIGGDYDYLIRIATSGIEGYEQLHQTKLSKLPHVSRLKTNFALREVLKRSNPII